MAWPLTQIHKDSFIQFLEPNPPLNNHKNLNVNTFSFYSSELKNIKQLVDCIFKINTGQLQGIDTTSERYRNTMKKMGLIINTAGVFTLSKIGLFALNYLSTNSLSVNNIASQTNRNHALEIEKIIIDSLIDELIKGDSQGLCSITFKEILFNAQEIYNNIPPNQKARILSDLDILYFLQSINSTGDEVKRYFRLSSVNQTDFYKLWLNYSDASTFPAAAANGIIDEMVYQYCRPRAKKTIQFDCRFRIEAFLKAYDFCVTKYLDKMPFLNKNLDNLNQRITNSNMNNSTNRNFELSPKPVLTLTDKPRQRIISGCPGSGKSLYIETEAKALDNCFLVKTTFHQETTYYDFVGTYKPTPLYEKNDDIVNSAGVKFDLGKPVINYSFVFGHLIESYLFAIKNPNWNIALVIDEINRGNVGVIFGDFFQLLDRDQDESYESKYSILPNADLIEFLRGFDFMEAILNSSKNHIKLPGNLFIWGTMNSADQGVFPIDSAFRRRWEFEYKGYNEVCAYGSETLKYNNKDITWESFRNQINKKLLTDLNIPEDKLIGPYFLSSDEIKSPAKVLNKLILYLWDDVARFQHKELMNFDSFADLKTTWKDGQGEIFTFDLIYE
jgi:5-methylcytosine-specific restriction protein B